MRNIILKSSAFLILLFGLLSLFKSISITFDLFNMRKLEGHYVVFVVISNFICSIIYLSASYGFFKGKNWTTTILFIAALLLIFIFIILVIYIFNGGIYEEKTIIEITLRTFITLVFTLVSWNFISKKNQFLSY